jgi:carbonic anhydrase
MNKKIKQKNLSRRNLLKLGTVALGTGTLTAGLSSNLASSQTPPAARKDITPEQALQLLMEGNDRFVNRRTINSTNRDIRRIKQVSKTQTPFASILSCADSRVPSEIIFDQGFGDLFVCRVAGNIATPEEIGSLEFGTAVLNSKVIMVMGHERCGAVAATIKGAQVPGQIGSLIEAIKPAVEKSKGQPGDQLENACKANVLYQVERLKSSPVLTGLIKEGKVTIVGGYYDLDTGTVTMVS